MKIDRFDMELFNDEGKKAAIWNKGNFEYKDAMIEGKLLGSGASL